eukprot:1161989-Pelagomonas_calceolata.AAC.2
MAGILEAWQACSRSRQLIWTAVFLGDRSNAGCLEEQRTRPGVVAAFLLGEMHQYACCARKTCCKCKSNPDSSQRPILNVLGVDTFDRQSPRAESR